MRSRTLLFDGAMGTMLQQRGLKVGGCPEALCHTHPDTVLVVHKAYCDAGADIIITNTFQANRLKLPAGYDVADTVTRAVDIAKRSGAKYVALDIGPLGQIYEPLGTFTFDRAYELFAEQMIAGERAGADCILIETLIDLYEAKIAVLAAKENTSLPVFCTLTYGEDGRTFMGCDPVTQTLTLCGLGVDAVGVNCSLGPAELAPIAKSILEYATVPVIVQANAGLPSIGPDGETIFNVGPQEYCDAVRPLLDSGVALIGGCCGTTPAHIAKLDELRRAYTPQPPAPKRVTAATSGTTTVIFDDRVTVIGERINPTGKKKLQQALSEGRTQYILAEAIDQTGAGSDILDVNVGMPGIDEPELLKNIVREIQCVTTAPLQIDSAKPEAIRAAVRIYNGKPIINSVNGKAESMSKIFPIAKKYGAAVLGLTLDERGIPETAEGRVEIAKKLLATAAEYGIPKEDLLIDCLVLTASTGGGQALETLRAVRMVRELGLQTVLGVSNVSFGLPQRSLLNSTFLAGALAAGLSAPILNPLSEDYMAVVDSFKVLSGQDAAAARYIARYAGRAQETPQPTGSELDLVTIITQGRRGAAGSKVRQLLEGGLSPLELIDEYFAKALGIVGERYAAQEVFLPQLIQSAETVKAGFAELKSYMLAHGEQSEPKGTIVLATVSGDIHDIGKNIAALMLENYGYNIIDLGKDVPAARVLSAVREHSAGLIGLSALMTTTAENMRGIIAELHAAGVTAKIMVGGAVLSREYAQRAGADYYAPDALAGVEIAGEVFGKQAPEHK